MQRTHQRLRLIAVALAALGLVGAAAVSTPAAEAGRTTRGTVSFVGGP